MGLLDPVKDLYYHAEEKYYKVLDKIDGTIPIYKLVDPVDSVIPSFAILLLLLFIVLALIVGTVVSLFLIPTTSTLSIKVMDSEGLSIEGASVKFSVFGEEIFSETTNAEGISLLENIELGSEVFLEVEKDSYLTDTKTTTITETPEQFLSVTLEKESRAVLSKTIRIVDSLGANIAKNFTLSFMCSYPYATPPEDIPLTPSDNGVAQVNVPTNCEVLLVSVKDDAGFDPVSSFEIFPEESDVKILLKEADQSKGTINVLLRSEGSFVEESVEVQLFRFEELLTNPEIGPINFDYSSAGMASFNVSPGNYLLKSVATSSLGSATSSKISIQAEEEEEVTLELARNIAGEIKIQVIDSESNEPIDDAKVTLKYQSDDTVLATKTTEEDEEAIVIFNISRDVTFRAVVQAEGYRLGKRESLKISDTVFRIELDSCTPSTCGELRVKVMDTDGESIENSTVALYNADNDFLAGYSNKTSDANGEVEFRGVESGNYYAFAFKESVSGRSDTAFFSSSAEPSEETHLTVTMIIPTGIIKAVVRDQDNAPVAYPVVYVYDERTNELIGSSFGDVNGVYSIETKADKLVYLKIRQKEATPKFADYTTLAKRVLPESVQTFNVTLEPEIISADIEIEFLGLFFNDDQLATVLSKGEEYFVKFKLRVPEGKGYSTTGVHIRTGEELIMEKDPLFIKSVSSPKTSQIKAASFDESSGYQGIDYDFTNNDAKWVNVVWSEPNAGIFEIQAVVKVKETASITDELKIFYRAWAQNGSRERHPQDDTITQELYSEAFSEIYEIGIATLCDKDFCFSARIRDFDEGLTESVIDSFNAKMISDYELKFTITNNSDFKIHDRANLRIKNSDETLLFTDYELLDAQSITTPGVLGAYEFPRFDVGKLEAKNKVEFITSFTTQKSRTGTINIKLVSDERIVFEKNIDIIVNATKQFEIRIQPSSFPSGIENDINVLVLDTQTSLEVDEAIVRIKDKHDNVILSSKTGLDGYAKLALPSQLPGSILFIEIEKPSFQTKIVEVEIKDDIIEINPDQLGLALNTKTKHSAQEKFFITNLTPFPLQISKIGFRGTFRNLVDRLATKNALAAYQNFVIEENKTEEFVIKAFLTEEGKALSQRKDIEAFLDIEVSNFGKVWGFSVPLKIAIDLEGAVDNPNCLILNRSTWQTTTEGSPVRMEFQLENNCVVEGQPIELKKLQAQIDLESNNLGIFDIAIGENKTELRSGYNKTLLTRIQPEERIVGIITFTPFGGVNGEALAKIRISASNPQETNEQIFEQEIAAKISVVNLVNCVSIDPVLLQMVGPKQSEAVTFFNINAGVGSVPCGGPIDYEIESELEVTPKTGRVEDGAKQKIDVFRGDAIQGQYPVFIKAKFGSEQEEQLLGTVRVRISEDGCIQLSRYEYDLLDTLENEFDGFDTATVSNKCFDKPIPVRVNLRSFTEAMKFGSTVGLTAFGVGSLGWLLDGGTGKIADLLKGDKEEGDGDEKPEDDEKPGGATTGGADNDDEGDGEKPPEDGEEPSPNGARVEPPEIPSNTGVYTLEEITELGVERLVLIDPDLRIYATYGGSGPKYFQAIQTSIGDYAYYPYDYEFPSETGETGNTMGIENPFAQGTGTGLAALFASGTPTGLQTGGFGSLGSIFSGGGILGAGSNLLKGILGTGNPFMQGASSFLIATIADYYTQEKEARFVVVQRDTEIMGLELQNPGEELARSNVFNQFLSSRTVSKLVTKNIPEQLREFAPYFYGNSSFLNVFTGGDEDIEVEQELRTTMKALPQRGLSPAMMGAFFGDRASSILPALALSVNPEASNQKIEKRGIVFRNKSSFTTTPDEPMYKILRVIAVRHSYKDKVYDRDHFDIENERSWFDFSLEDPIIDPESAELEEDIPQPVDEVFHLEFNAIPPEQKGDEFPPLLNCQDGTRIGSTGPDALPKVKFNWSWSGIEEDECNVDNDRGVYCDATQFSISLLKKIKVISDWLQTTGSGLDCPSPYDSYSNPAIIPDYDIGISNISVSKSGNSALIKVTVENKNPGEIATEVRVDLANASSGEIVSGQACTHSKTVLSEEVFECNYSGLENGNYIAMAAITPTVDCSNCEDQTQSNSLTINFQIGESGVGECEPYSTERLDRFVAVSGVEADSILEKIKFQAYLIEDRYSSDFQSDFDLFAKTQSFFDAPVFYTGEKTGLGTFFSDSELFGFSSKFDEPNPEGYRLSGAGIYNVTIDIVYNDSSWSLFEDNNPNAKIIVYFEKADTPKPDSPFYNLPFDGIIGDNGRVNYGLNYRGDNISINNEIDSLVRTIEISGSSPISELTIEKKDSFKELNTDERGRILRVTKVPKPTLTFSPSYATPVILKISNEFEDAYAFYSVEVNGGAVNTGSHMNRWNGVGFNCKAFDDRFMSEFSFQADTHGLNEFLDCARLPPEMEQTSYGFQFCSPKKFGNMFLKTVFYTPQGNQNFLKLNVAQEEASFITPSSSGEIVALDHTVLSSEIKSVEDIFNLVSAGFVCVSNEESTTEFWWNPKKVFEQIEGKESDLINSCITG